jgi:predicted Rossmann fold nucleotide-binding protein DprA/Smf involved in DNA uptake
MTHTERGRRDVGYQGCRGNLEAPRGRPREADRTAGRRSRTAAQRDRQARGNRAGWCATQSNARAPRGQNRRAILEAIKDEAKTAGDVAKETGIGRPTVSTTLTKLVSDGAAVKAKRGYKAA